jgi:hypothetical protein
VPALRPYFIEHTQWRAASEGAGTLRSCWLARVQRRLRRNDPKRWWVWLLVVAAVILVIYFGLRFGADLGLDQLFGK